MDTTVLNKIEKEFFKDAAISFEPRVEGQEIVNGLPVIGARAGPEIALWNLIHEMAHFVEIDDKRMCADYRYSNSN